LFIVSGFVDLFKTTSNLYPPSQEAANFGWRMNAIRVSAKAMLAMGRIASIIANMISVGGCASAGFAEAGALVTPTSVGVAPRCLWSDF
jgi:hypothetical protein